MQQLTDQGVGQRKYVPGQYLDIALQWFLIHPRKVLHINLYKFVHAAFIKINFTSYLWE